MKSTPNNQKLVDLFNKIAPPKEKQFYSVGHLCLFFAGTDGTPITTAQVRVLMQSAGVKFAELRDTIPYVDGDGLQKLVDAYKKITDEINDVAESYANN